MAGTWFVRIIREWNDVVNVVAGITGSRPRALAAVEGMKLQAYYGECFAGFAHLGKRGELSTKAIQRMMAQLVEGGLIERTRLVRKAGTQGTYRVDWTRLWSRVAAALANLRQRRSRAGWEEEMLAQGNLLEIYSRRAAERSIAESRERDQRGPPDRPPDPKEFLRRY